MRREASRRLGWFYWAGDAGQSCQTLQPPAVRADSGLVIPRLALPTKARHSVLDAAARAVLAAGILAASAALPSSANASSGSPRAAPRERAHVAVVGGQSAQPGAFPWMAYVLDFKGNTAEQCSGTVVAPNLVLTAGHCAEEVQTGVVDEASGYQVMTGNVDVAAAETQRQVSSVTRVIVCGCFDRHTAVGDVALLQLSAPTSAPAITLASSPPAGTAALLAGWGNTYAGQTAPVERLQWAPTVVQSPASCEREASPFIPDAEICAIDPPTRHTGACNGDSGGPLLVAQPAAPGGMVQIGVTSHVYGECATTSPSVFTRVDAVSTWVKGWIQALAGAPPASSLPATLVAEPTLAGVASDRSIGLGGGAVSLLLSCDSDGGVCNGEAEATIKVREERIARVGDRRTLSTRRLQVTLASVVFSIAPGASVAVHSRLSPQTRALLSRLGGGPLEVMLTGPGIAHRVITLERA
jgi:secreted trypsin-like serine protease